MALRLLFGVGRSVHIGRYDDPSFGGSSVIEMMPPSRSGVVREKFGVLVAPDRRAISRSVPRSRVDLATSSRPPVVFCERILEVRVSYTRAARGSTPKFSTAEANEPIRPRKRAVSPRTVRWLRRLEAVAILVGSFVLAALVVSNRPGVEHVLAQLGWLAMPLAIVVFAIVASAPFSVTDALAIMNGALFGPLWGSVVNAIGLVLAAIIGYVVALRTSAAFDVKKSVERLPSWARHFKIGSPMFLICVRIIPGLGGTIATQTAAALRVPIIRQIYTMCAIAIPICTILAVFGDRASDYFDAHVVEPVQANMEKHHIHFPHRRPHPHAQPSVPGVPPR